VKRGKFEVKMWSTSGVVMPIEDSNGGGDEIRERTRQEVRRQALSYTMINGDLYRWTVDGLLLRCLNEEEAKVAMREVHEGMCRTHQLAHKMW
jgi:hypothetical protein